MWRLLFLICLKVWSLLSRFNLHVIRLVLVYILKQLLNFRPTPIHLYLIHALVLFHTQQMILLLGDLICFSSLCNILQLLYILYGTDNAGLSYEILNTVWFMTIYP